MAGAKIRFQGSKEGHKDVDTLSVLMFFQEVCQALTRKEERCWSLVETVKLREKSLLRIKMLEQERTNETKSQSKQVGMDGKVDTVPPGSDGELI